MAFVYIAIILALLIIDQVTKYIVVIKMTRGESITIIKDFFYITSARNKGAAWSMFEGQMVLFYVITVIALGFFIYYLIKEGSLIHNHLFTISLLMVISGALGNFIDRLFRKEVVDFLDFIIFRYNFPIFNVADILLSIGTFGLAIAVLFYSE